MPALLSLFAVITFLLLGHLFVCVILKRFLNENDSDDDTSLSAWKADLKICLKRIYHGLIYSTDTSAIFTLMCLGVFIALFWGWAPATLLIVIGHLFISNSLCTLADFKDSYEQDATIKDFFQARRAGTETPSLFKNRQAYIWLVIYSFCILLFALLVDLSTHVLSLNSGSLFLIASVTIAILYTIGDYPKPLKIILTLISFLFGFILSNHLGLYIIGHWQPIKSLETLQIDERWIYAAIVITATYFIRGITLKASMNVVVDNTILRYFKRMNQVSHVLNLSIILMLFIYAIIERPPVDTPMHATTENLPTYIAFIAIILFFSAGNLFALISKLFPSPIESLRVNLPTLPLSNNEQSIGRISSISLTTCLCALILLFLYSSSTGLGAWQTHFNNWSSDKPLIDLFSASVNSITAALTFFSLPEAVAKNLVYGTLLLNVLLLLIKLMRLCEQSIAILHQLSNTQLLARRNNLFISIILVTALLVFGSSINTWILIGILSVSGVLIFSINALSSLLNARKNGHPFIWLGTCLVLFVFFLTLAITIKWFNSHPLLAIISLLFILMTLYALSHKLLSIFHHIKSREDTNSLNLADEDNNSA